MPTFCRALHLNPQPPPETLAYCPCLPGKSLLLRAAASQSESRLQSKPASKQEMGGACTELLTGPNRRSPGMQTGVVRAGEACAPRKSNIQSRTSREKEAEEVRE